MKAITIPQPWAQLVVRGFKTTFESSWEISTFPLRVLVIAGPVDPRYENDSLPDTVKLLLDNAIQFGYINPEQPLITDAILGYVDIMGCEEDCVTEYHDPNSSDNPRYTFFLENARRFRDPHLGYKGRRGLVEIDDIDEDEFKTAFHPNILSRDEHILSLPISQDLMDSVKETGDFGAISFNVLDSNVDIFCERLSDGIQPRQVDYLYLYPDYYHDYYRVTDIEIVEMTDDVTGDPILYTDQYGEKRPYTKVVFSLVNAYNEIPDDISQTGKEVYSLLQNLGLPYVVLPDFNTDNSGQLSYSLSNGDLEVDYNDVLIDYDFIVNVKDKLVTLSISLKQKLPNKNFLAAYRTINHYNHRNTPIWLSLFEPERYITAHTARSFLVDEVDYEELAYMFDETFELAKKMRRHIEIEMNFEDEDSED